MAGSPALAASPIERDADAVPDESKNDGKDQHHEQEACPLRPAHRSDANPADRETCDGTTSSPAQRPLGLVGVRTSIARR